MHINQTPALINILFLLPILFLQVFEDDCILSQATDSGCPSESLLEDEGTAEKQNVDLPASSNHPKGKPTSLTWRSRFDRLLTEGLRSKRTINLSPAASSSDPPSPVHHPPPPSSPTHDHLGLEWDPSVDIGRSVSRDDADSSYFSASTGNKQQNRCLTLHGKTSLRNLRWHTVRMQICSVNRIFVFCRSEEVELPEFLWLSVWHQRRHQRWHQEPGGRLGELKSF